MGDTESLNQCELLHRYQNGQTWTQKVSTKSGRGAEGERQGMGR